MCQAMARLSSFFFFFNDTATTEIYTLSLHDALPISDARVAADANERARDRISAVAVDDGHVNPRSEEHTSELQSQSNFVCRLLLEKKKTRFPTSDPIRCTRCPQAWT